MARQRERARERTPIPTNAAAGPPAPVGVAGAPTAQSSPVVSTLYNVAWPSGYSAVAGDVALMLMSGHNSGPSLPTNTDVPGFTKVPSAGVINGSWEFTQPWYKVLVGGESIPQFRITSGAVTQINAVVVIIRGVNTSTPLDATSVTKLDTGTTHSATAITTVTNNSLVVVMLQRGNTQSTGVPGGWTALASGVIVGARTLTAFSKLFPVAGVATPGATTSAGGATTQVSATMALRPI